MQTHKDTKESENFVHTMNSQYISHTRPYGQTIGRLLSVFLEKISGLTSPTGIDTALYIQLDGAYFVEAW